MDHRAREDLHALLFEDEREVLAKLFVHVGQQPVHALDDGDLAAEVCVERRKLDADDAAADDDDGAVQMIAALQQLIGGHGKLQTGDGRARGDRARGDEDIVTGVVLGVPLRVRYADAAGRGDERRAAQKIYLCGFEQRLDAGGQPLRDFALVGENFLNVGADVVGVDADARAVFRIVIDL